MLKYTILISLVLVNAQGDTTPSSQGTTPIAILQSAQANGLPSWTVPGVVTSLKSVYKSLDSTTQTQIQTLINNPDLSVDKLIKKLGTVIDTSFTQAQQDNVRDLMTQAEMDRRTAGGSLQENDNLTAEAQEVFSGLIETVIDTDLSLVQQCIQIKNVVGSSSPDTLASLGIPTTLSTVDCSNLAPILLS